MRDAAPCTGAIGADGIDRVRCKSCARYEAGATGWVLTGKTFRYYGGGEAVIVQCLDRLEIAPAHADDRENVSARFPRYASVSQREARVNDVPARKARLFALAAAGVALAAALAWSTSASAAGCGPWNPAADPYQGDQAQAVMRLTEIPEHERRLLADMVRQAYAWQRVYVSRDGVVGSELGELRDMNYGTGRICPGPVDRSTWPAGRHEAARAYRVGRWAVLVMDSCRNVALATNYSALPPPRAYTAADVRAGYRGGLGAPSMTVPEPTSLGLALGALTVAGVITQGRAARRSRRKLKGEA